MGTFSEASALEANPTQRATDATPRNRHLRNSLASVFLLCLAFYTLEFLIFVEDDASTALSTNTPITDLYRKERFQASLDQCRSLYLPAGPSPDFASRTISDRFVPGTKPTLILNATVWTGENDGKEVIEGGDVWLEGGIIKGVGEGYESQLRASGVDLSEVNVINAHGRWLTPGLFDLHAHLGVDSAPDTFGAQDTNSLKSPVMPYLRSLDGFNTHDLSFKRTISGGVTTSLVLPGSANNIGGQAFVFKLRKTQANTPSSMLLEPPDTLPKAYRNVTDEEAQTKKSVPWRHMKMACGENAKRIYGITRMDESYNFRSLFDKAAAFKNSQDAYCARAFDAHKKGEVLTDEIPTSLEYEAVADAIRHRVKINVHCYETTDFDAMVSHSNEFSVPIAAFHHAHEAYLVPDRIKQTYNPWGTPTIAMFALSARYKRESYRGTPFAGHILHQNDIPVSYKSDHPVLDSRYLLFEAQQAHHFGVPAHIALASVTTTSATTAGFGHRLGRVRVGNDADVVLWQSGHPLSLGATPEQVWIDGQPQLEKTYPTTTPEDASKTSVPIQANFTAAQRAQLVDVAQGEVVEQSFPVNDANDVKLINISEVFYRDPSSQEMISQFSHEPLSAVVRKGEIVCLGITCSSTAEASLPTVDLKGGAVLPPISSYGPLLGLAEITSEISTMDGAVIDPFADDVSSSLRQGWGAKEAVKAIDGLQLGGKQLYFTRKSGVLRSITAPLGFGFFRGISVYFRVGGAHALEPGTVLKEEAALHVSLSHDGPSISTQIDTFRHLLLSDLSSISGSFTSDTHSAFAAVANGTLPVVVAADKADHIVALLRVKNEVESAFAAQGKKISPIKLVIEGAQESHLVASLLAAQSVGVILTRPRPFPGSFDSVRALDGPPLQTTSLPVVLAEHKVPLALGADEEFNAQQLLWEAGWIAQTSAGRISRSEALSWVAGGLERVLDLAPEQPKTSAFPLTDFVAFEGDPLAFGSRAVLASERGRLEYL